MDYVISIKKKSNGSNIKLCGRPALISTHSDLPPDKTNVTSNFQTSQAAIQIYQNVKTLP